jgi:predicted RNA binding protein YcfA (HicA-like mRNA interferase family)
VRVAKLGPLSGAEVVSGLRRLGFERIGQRGSHVKMRHPDGRCAIVPMHAELAKGTLASILRQAHATLEQLTE